ncbi:MAG: Asp-tRNA(Asn)/Glu-tRNA(Gln) amidotransferase subunit GatC [Desulfobacterales bacterium]
MKITKEEVIHVADLARLDMGEEAIDGFADQIGNILTYVDTLKQVDTTDVDATTHAISLSNVFREDEEKTPIARDAAQANAPEKEDGLFLVPKVIDG